MFRGKALKIFSAALSVAILLLPFAVSIGPDGAFGAASAAEKISSQKTTYSESEIRAICAEYLPHFYEEDGSPVSLLKLMEDSKVVRVKDEPGCRIASCEGDAVMPYLPKCAKEAGISYQEPSIIVAYDTFDSKRVILRYEDDVWMETAVYDIPNDLGFFCAPSRVDAYVDYMKNNTVSYSLTDAECARVDSALQNKDYAALEKLDNVIVEYGPSGEVTVKIDTDAIDAARQAKAAKTLSPGRP